MVEEVNALVRRLNTVPAKDIEVGEFFEWDGKVFKRVEILFTLPSYSQWSNSPLDVDLPSCDHVFSLDFDNKLWSIHPDNMVVRK
jgi:hypothetical protein